MGTAKGKLKVIIMTEGEIVLYVVGTDFGEFVLPARIIAFEDDGGHSLRVFTDKGGSEWIVKAFHSELKTAGTWHVMEAK